MLKRLIVIVLVLAFALLLAVSFAFRSYRIFTSEEMVAIIQCEPPREGSGFDFQLKLTPVVGGMERAPTVHPMHGEQWMIGGEYLKWHPWLNLLGLKNRHKLTWLSSRYVAAEAELKKSRSVYELNGGTGRAWLLLYRIQSVLPFVEAVYGNAAYTMAYSGGTWGVYATPSGYLVRRIRPPQR
ncbi:MAG: hypothetical protein NC910_00075 [Candidatus Omnitrophica bacterium]|nr:hypothetical protein [Candidatus Omnitrophota bacterium]